MAKELLFFLVILVSNIIQGITGFAGTLLAMPFSLKLVGYDTAVPVLNALGIVSGVYVLIGNYKSVDWKEMRRVVVVMGISILAGLGIKQAFAGNMQILYYVLGVIILVISGKGFYNLFWLEPALASENEYAAEVRGRVSRNRNFHEMPHNRYISRRRVALFLILILAGLVHGIFVCGGPILIAYLAKRVRSAAAFRATISTVWIFLNGIIFLSQLLQGMWSVPLVKTQIIAIPFLLGGMVIGGILYKHISQRAFMILTYVLLTVSGVTLFFK